MITAVRKPFSEISRMLAGRNKLLILGCGTCVTVCMAGGEKEVAMLASLLRLANRKGGTAARPRGGTAARPREGKPMEIDEAVVERQCDREFFDAVRDKVEASDAVLSMACGVGAQFCGEVFPDKIVLPALDTKFYGATVSQGVWAERCVGCGSCVIGDFGGICPVTRCSKGLLNGPCSGSENGMCEVDPLSIECGWQLVYDRMKARGELGRLETLIPPMDWSKGRCGGPGKIVKEDAVL